MISGNGEKLGYFKKDKDIFSEYEHRNPDYVSKLEIELPVGPIAKL